MSEDKKNKTDTLHVHNTMGFPLFLERTSTLEPLKEIQGGTQVPRS